MSDPAPKPWYMRNLLATWPGRAGFLFIFIVPEIMGTFYPDLWKAAGWHDAWRVAMVALIVVLGLAAWLNARK